MESVGEATQAIIFALLLLFFVYFLVRVVSLAFFKTWREHKSVDKGHDDEK